MNSKKHSLGSIFIIALLLLLLLCAAAVIVLGLRAYQKSSDGYEKNFNARTSLLYLTQKLRQHDENGTVRITRMGDSDALLFSDSVGDFTICTYVYVYNGSLRELCVLDSVTPTPADGWELMKASDLSLSATDDRTLALCATDAEGRAYSTVFCLNSAALEELP